MSNIDFYVDHDNKVIPADKVISPNKVVPADVASKQSNRASVALEPVAQPSKVNDLQLNLQPNSIRDWS